MLKELSGTVNSFVIMRENVQSSLGHKCLQEAGDILGEEEALSPSPLIIPIPTLLAPRRVGVIAGLSRT